MPKSSKTSRKKESETPYAGPSRISKPSSQAGPNTHPVTRDLAQGQSLRKQQTLQKELPSPHNQNPRIEQNVQGEESDKDEETGQDEQTLQAQRNQVARLPLIDRARALEDPEYTLHTYNELCAARKRVSALERKCSKAKGDDRKALEGRVDDAKDWLQVCEGEFVDAGGLVRGY